MRALLVSIASVIVMALGAALVGLPVLFSKPTPKASADLRPAFIFSTPAITIRDPNRPDLQRKIVAQTPVHDFDEVWRGSGGYFYAARNDSVASEAAEDIAALEATSFGERFAALQ